MVPIARPPRVRRRYIHFREEIFGEADDSVESAPKTKATARVSRAVASMTQAHSKCASVRGSPRSGSTTWLLVAQLDAEQRSLCFADTVCFAATRFVRVVRSQRQMGRRKEVADLLEQCKNEAHGDSRLVTAFARVFPWE